MKTWKAITSVAAAAAVGAAAFALKKRASSPDSASAAAEKPKTGKKAPVNLSSGSYSFVSGFKDATTVDVGVSYDGDKFSFAVCEDDFLAYSGDSHVAIMYGEDFNIQIEYASYYQGEDFEAMAAHAREKFGAVDEQVFGGNRAIRYMTGDAVCVCISIPDDSYSYILVTCLKAKDSDEELCDIAVDPAFTDILNGISFKKA